MNEEWERKIFSSAELEELTNSYDKIIYNNENGIVVNLGLSNDFCISLCKHWFRSRHEGNFYSMSVMEAFFHGFIEHIEEHLEEEGINWRYEPDSD
jgi:hypothetical protein